MATTTVMTVMTTPTTAAGLQALVADEVKLEQRERAVGAAGKQRDTADVAHGGSRT